MKNKLKTTIRFFSERISFLGLALLVCVMAVSCERYEPQKDDPPIKDSCNCIMDTLKGEWKWVKIVTGEPTVIRDSSFMSIVKILSQNADSSINYEVWVEDSLFSQGSFQIKDMDDGWFCSPNYFPNYHSVVIDIKHFRLPFFPPVLGWNEEWNMLFTNKMPQDTIIEGYTTDYPLMVLWVCGINYYYQKIK